MLSVTKRKRKLCCKDENNPCEYTARDDLCVSQNSLTTWPTYSHPKSRHDTLLRDAQNLPQLHLPRKWLLATDQCAKPYNLGTFAKLSQAQWAETRCCSTASERNDSLWTPQAFAPTASAYYQSRCNVAQGRTASRLWGCWGGAGMRVVLVPKHVGMWYALARV
jgi:hypothetical protein